MQGSLLDRMKPDIEPTDSYLNGKMELQFHAEGQPRSEALSLLDLADSNHPDSPTGHGFLCISRLHTRIGIIVLLFYKGITTTSMVLNKTSKLNICAKLL
eukprot:9981867-Ditylum_brightwellii.AAC.1